MRTRSGSASGQDSACRLRWIVTAAKTAALALSKTAKRLSPSPRGRTSRPPARSTSCSMSWSWRASAARIPAGWSSQSRVLPSTSVKRKVTVPVGRPPPTAPASASEPLFTASHPAPTDRGGFWWVRWRLCGSAEKRLAQRQALLRGIDWTGHKEGDFNAPPFVLDDGAILSLRSAFAVVSLLLVDAIQKCAELGGAVSAMQLADDFASSHIQGGKQRPGTETLVVRGPRRSP